MDVHTKKNAEALTADKGPQQSGAPSLDVSITLERPIVVEPRVIDYYYVGATADQSTRTALSSVKELPAKAQEVAAFFSEQQLPLGFIITDAAGVPYKVGIPYDLPMMLADPQKMLGFEELLLQLRNTMPDAIGFQMREDYYKVYDEHRPDGVETMKMWIVVIDPLKN